jgi:hypothetical protein
VRPLLVGLTALVLLALAAPAGAAGAQGVDLQPLLPRRDGFLTTTVQRDTTFDVRLVNEAEEPRTVTVTARVVDRDGLLLGAAAPWLTVPGAEAITLAPGAERVLQARVDLAGYREAATEWAALVLAVEGGGNVVAQAATVVHLSDGGAQLPLPVGLLVLAAALLAAAASAWVRWGRPQLRRPEGAAAPTAVERAQPVG